MGTFALIILCLLIGFIMWVRYQWRHNPGKILRMIFRIPSPEKEAHRRSGGKASAGSRNPRRGRKGAKRDESIIPKEYAEDVEYVEIKEFTRVREEEISADGKTKRVYTESQVSDAEWVEIKEKK